MALVILVGLPGVGKSSLGRALSLVRECDFVDVDELVAKDVGELDAGAVIQVHGIEAFRELESESLARALTSPGIVATGGGVIEKFSNRQLLRQHGRIVWLDCDDDVLVDRVRGTNRPLLNDDAAARLVQLRRQREGLYREVATATVMTSSSFDESLAGLTALVSKWVS
jgi:shikimate kinase